MITEATGKEIKQWCESGKAAPIKKNMILDSDDIKPDVKEETPAEPTSEDDSKKTPAKPARKPAKKKSEEVQLTDEGEPKAEDTRPTLTEDKLQTAAQYVLEGKYTLDSLNEKMVISEDMLMKLIELIDNPKQLNE